MKEISTQIFYIFKLKQMYLNWQYVISGYLPLVYFSFFSFLECFLILLCVHIYSLCGYKYTYFLKERITVEVISQFDRLVVVYGKLFFKEHDQSISI